jgi:type IV pilus assembly protein PilM
MGLFSKNLVGLDIGSNCLKLVQLRESGKAWHLVHYAIQPVSTDAVEEIDPDLKETVLAEALKKLYKSAKVSNRNVVTAVSGDAVIVRYVKLPFMTEEELRNVISYEAEQHIPLPIEQVVVDFHILGEVQEDNQKKLEVLLVAAKEEMIDQHIRILGAASLKPKVIDVDSFALENSYEANYGKEIGETVALINVGAKITTINVVEDGVSHLTRDFAVAGNQFTKEIQREFNLSFSQAEELKKAQGMVLIESDEISLTRMPDKDDRSSRISEALTPVLNKLLSELKRSFDFYENSIKGRPISKVMLSGGSAKLKNLDRFLADKLGVAVVKADPFRNVIVHLKESELEMLHEDAPMLAVSLGLALRKA